MLMVAGLLQLSLLLRLASQQEWHFLQDVWRMLMGGQKIPEDVIDLFKSSKAASGGLAEQVRQEQSCFAALLRVDPVAVYLGTWCFCAL